MKTNLWEGLLSMLLPHLLFWHPYSAVPQQVLTESLPPASRWPPVPAPPEGSLHTMGTTLPKVTGIHSADPMETNQGPCGQTPAGTHCTGKPPPPPRASTPQPASRRSQHVWELIHRHQQALHGDSTPRGPLQQQDGQPPQATWAWA